MTSSMQTRRRNATGLAHCVMLILAMDVLRTATHQMPSWSLKAAALAGACFFAVKIVTFRRWSDETRCVPKFLFWFVLMLAELSVENGLVWIVSATDMRKYEHVPALQDNIELSIRLMAPGLPLLHWFSTFHWANIMHFLLAVLALAFSVIWEQVPYSGFGIMARVVGTIAGSRLLRTVCFLSTVLPNPRPGCYSRRFPPVPDTAWETIKAGYTTIRGFGGCNDLIFSGHAAFWVLAPLAYMTYYRPQGSSKVGATAATALLWLALLQACLRDIMEHHHYSVDMILAVVVTWACWTWLEFIYPPSSKVLPRAPGAPRDPLNPLVLLIIVVGLLTAGIIVIGGKA